jgi:hypothetical protein
LRGRTSTCEAYYTRKDGSGEDTGASKGTVRVWRTRKVYGRARSRVWEYLGRIGGGAAGAKGSRCGFLRHSSELTWPADVVLKSIFIPYPRRSNIYCMGLPHPRTMNASISLRTHSKLLCPPLLPSSLPPPLLYPLSSNSNALLDRLNSSSAEGRASYSARYTTMKWATLITADKIDGYMSAPRNPVPLGLTPNAANAQTNAMSYSWL